jgi:DNA invertase Pin-like site-specific DNA recombinase
VSGASVLLAPEIQNLMVLMQAPEVHGVVAREFSRLMRPEKFSDYALLQAFLDTNTVLYLPDGPIDLNNKSGFLLGGMRALMAGTERREILERVWTAKESKRSRGEHPQSQICLPYGVGYANGKFFYKQEADRVREAYVRFMSGETSYHQLAQIGGWSLPGIRNILRNPIYTGWRVYDKKRDMSAAGRYTDPLGRQTDRKKVKRATEEVIRVKVIDEPLISEADWQQVQRVMDAKRAKH